MVAGDRAGERATTEARRVLVVDDDPDIRRIFETALTDGWHVTTAVDGDEAKSFLENNPIACLVADHMMPGMTGIDLCREAAVLQPHAGRVLVTASERMRDLTDAINVGRVHRFLPKPVRIADLVAVVTDAVRVCDIERQNAVLVAELRDKNKQLQTALHAVTESEKRLEREVQERTLKLREANAELEKLALRDGLTGLYNHRFFQEALNTELARAARYGNSVGLVFLDVDHFKNYNDTNGHPAGDELLRQLARILVATDDVRYRGRVSDIAARYGGEEFVVILPMTDLAGTTLRAERIREMVADHPFAHREKQPLGHVSVSAGVAAYPLQAADKVSLIQAADDALLLAKRTGRNRVVPARPKA
jgi:diguanylate cyclase (GGDEF)-like protein